MIGVALRSRNGEAMEAGRHFLDVLGIAARPPPPSPTPPPPPLFVSLLLPPCNDTNAYHFIKLHLKKLHLGLPMASFHFLGNFAIASSSYSAIPPSVIEKHLLKFLVI